MEINMYLGKNLAFDEKAVLLGANLINGLGASQTPIINEVITVAKLSISKFRYGPNRPLLDIYHTEANIRKLWDVHH